MTREALSRQVAGVSLQTPWSDVHLQVSTGPVYVYRSDRTYPPKITLRLSPPGEVPLIEHPLHLRDDLKPTPEDMPVLLQLLLDHHLLSHPEWLLPSRPPPAALEQALLPFRQRAAGLLALSTSGGKSLATMCRSCWEAFYQEEREGQRGFWIAMPIAKKDCPHGPALRQAALEAAEQMPTLLFEAMELLKPSSLRSATRYVLDSGTMKALIECLCHGKPRHDPWRERYYSSPFRYAPPRRQRRLLQSSDWEDSDSPWLRGAVAFSAQGWSYTTTPAALVPRPSDTPVRAPSFGPPVPSTAQRLLPELAPPAERPALPRGSKKPAASARTPAPPAAAAPVAPPAAAHAPVQPAAAPAAKPEAAAPAEATRPAAAARPTRVAKAAAAPEPAAAAKTADATRAAHKAVEAPKPAEATKAAEAPKPAAARATVPAEAKNPIQATAPAGAEKLAKPAGAEKAAKAARAEKPAKTARAEKPEKPAKAKPGKAGARKVKAWDWKL